MRSEPAEPDGNFRSGPSLRHANVVILTDETEFARSLTACWQTERQAPGVTVLNSDSWQDQDAPAHDLIVVGPVHRSEEHTSELQSPCNLVCRLLLEKKKINKLILSCATIIPSDTCHLAHHPT